MVATHEDNSLPQHHILSTIENSPTLARVERAFLRQDVIGQQMISTLERSILDPKYSLLPGKISMECISGPIKRGLLWQQRDRLFSRWKERYFILTRDYLHCFKRASGSATDRISDMGQFIFKVKLVDVEKVEWLNRRSYSVIGLHLGREGRVLLRADNFLEDWFELLDECTISSKQRRQALINIQAPRTRASLAVPPSHVSLQNNDRAHGSTYSNVLNDWIFQRNHTSSSAMHYPLSDSVPDLTGFSDISNMSKNPSTSQRIHFNLNMQKKSRYSANAIPYSNSESTSQKYTKNQLNRNNVNCDDMRNDNEVELRLKNSNLCDNGNKAVEDWMYRRPLGPNDLRHSLLTDIDISACDSGLDTPQSTTNRSCSYRDAYYKTRTNARDSTDTGVSSSRSTLVSPAGSFRANGNTNDVSIQENIQRPLTMREYSIMRGNDRQDPNQKKITNGMHQKHDITCTTAVMREQHHQHQLLTKVSSDTQGTQFRDRSYSDMHQQMLRKDTRNSSSSRRHPLFGNPTCV